MVQTRREEIVSLLKQDPWALASLAKFFSVPLNVIEDDIHHIEKSLASSYKLKIHPADCQSCGFIFRTKMKKPSRCPKCKSEYLTEPMVQLVEK